MEAVRTNVMGTDNMLHAATEAGVKRVVCLSTDKAAYPINAMGTSKAMMEHVITPMPVWPQSAGTQSSAAHATAM
jgi:UDP-glucose 4-epimerase